MVLTGYNESTARIRELPGGGTVKIVALTTSAFKEQRPKILAAGCDDVLLKPYKETEILTVIEKLLDLRYVYQETENLQKQPAETKLVLEDLQGLPDEWLDNFLTTVRLGDTEIMRDLTNTLDEEFAETKTKLNYCVKEIQLQYLIRLLEEKTGTTKKV